MAVPDIEGNGESWQEKPRLEGGVRTRAVFYFASLDSFLLCYWNHLGFVIVRLPDRLSVQPAEQPDQQDDWNRNANQPK